uniref:Uncharacterized protein n=1 Tax=Cacopsylla melanoneura TaxID=428564 RepID=A0A8D8QJX4_9HEMI
MFVFVYPVIFYISFIFKQIEFRAFCPFSSCNYSLATMLGGAEILNEIEIWKRCLLVVYTKWSCFLIKGCKGLIVSPGHTHHVTENAHAVLHQCSAFCVNFHRYRTHGSYLLL